LDSRFEVRFAAWLGVVGLALTVAGGLLAGEFSDTVGDSPSAIVEFYQGAAFDAGYVTGVVVETVGFLLVLAFVVKFAEVVSGGRDKAGWLATIVAVAATVATVLTFVSEAGLAAGTFRASHGGLVGDGYVVLADVRQFAYWVSLSAWALVYVTSGALMVRMRSFPPWLGWVGVGIGGAHLVVSFSDSVAVWDAATGVGGIWLVVSAVIMLVRATRYALPTTDRA